MNLHTFVLPDKFAVNKLDIDFFSKYQHSLMAMIRDEFFVDNYDSILKYELIRIVSDHCAIFEVSCLLQLDTDQINFCEGDPIEEEEKIYPSRALFFVLNLEVENQRFNLTKFYEVDGICNQIWNILAENFQEECQAEGIEEDDDVPSISFCDYYISYRMVIGDGLNSALFWVEHILQFIDPEGDLREFRVPVLTHAILFKIVYSDKDLLYCPTTTEVDLHKKKELA